MSSLDPGLDRHDWESRWRSLEDDVETDPAASLSELADLIESILVDTGYDVNDTVGRNGDEREVVAEYLAARETSDRVERAEDVAPGDVAAAINGLREIYEYLIRERGAT